MVCIVIPSSLLVDKSKAGHFSYETTRVRALEIRPGRKECRPIARTLIVDLGVVVFGITTSGVTKCPPPLSSSRTQSGVC